MEAEAVVSNAQPELGRLNPWEALYVTFAGSDEMSQGMEDAKSGRLVNSAKLILGMVLPDDLFLTMTTGRNGEVRVECAPSVRSRPE